MLLLVLLVGAVVTLDGAWEFNQPLHESAGAAIFRQPGLRLLVVESHNVLGFDLMETHELWAYTPTAPVHTALGAGNPLPRLRFPGPDPSVLDKDSLCWQPTGRGAAHPLARSLATSPALDRWPGSQQFARRDYLGHPGNAYGTYLNGRGGAYLFVWVPAAQRLYVVFDSRGAYYIEP
ncbi:hypothetical protein [Hymenobacter sublimis]|uniref:Uncharacterized protein n=1 Tax=Hymenobacter sublimis TaxID=2933777 RepID=A0ABY4JBK3_9BACT|nr:hypothetical protein [Hymenobacter sublimis]UPL50197.1 hypothetical protein MWH26_04635 [Hymenobacter sublimis]